MTTRTTSARRSLPVTLASFALALGLLSSTAGCSFSLDMAPNSPGGAEATLEIGTPSSSTPTADGAAATAAPPTASSGAPANEPASPTGTKGEQPAAASLIEASAEGLGLDGSLVLLRR